MSRFWLDLVGNRPTVTGKARWVGVELVDESTEGLIDAGSVGLADSHGNCSGAVTDLAGLAEQVACDSPVHSLYNSSVELHVTSGTRWL